MFLAVLPDYQSDSDSFNPILWEEQRQQRMTVAFDFEDKKEEEDNSGKVKVSSLSLCFCLSDRLSLCEVSEQRGLHEASGLYIQVLQSQR